MELLPILIAAPIGVAAIVANFFVPNLFLFVTLPLCLGLLILGFMMARALAMRQGHWIAFDYLQSEGLIRYVLVVGFFGYYFLAFLVMWWIAQVKSASAKPKLLLPWIGLQLFSVLLCCGGMSTAVVGDRNRAANHPMFQQGAPPAQAGQGHHQQVAKNDIAAKAEDVVPVLTGNAELDKALADIDSNNEGRMRTGAAMLNGMQPNEHRALVAKKLAAQVAGAKTHLRPPLIRALGVWSSTEDVPMLLRLLQDSDTSTRNEVLDVLGKLGDERGAVAAAQCYLELSTRWHAERALKNLGPVAEKAVQAILNHPDKMMRGAAIRLLQDIGTQESIAALEAAGTSDAFLRAPAQQAITAIRKRAMK